MPKMMVKGKMKHYSYTPEGYKEMKKAKMEMMKKRAKKG